MTTAIWRITRKVSRMRLAEKSAKDSAQSPPRKGKEGWRVRSRLESESRRKAMPLSFSEASWRAFSASHAPDRGLVRMGV